MRIRQCLCDLRDFYLKTGTNSDMRLSQKTFSAHFPPFHTLPEHHKDMWKPPSWRQAFSSVHCPSRRILFPGHCSRLSCHHWFPGLHIPKWESGLVTWFGHPENNSVLNVNSWSSKLQSDFFPKSVTVFYVYVCVCGGGKTCAYVCMWVFMNISF